VGDVVKTTAPEPVVPLVRSDAEKVCVPPRLTAWPASVIEELARLAFGSATMRALGNVPAVMFVAFVVSVVADGANRTPAVFVQEIFGTAMAQSPASVKPAKAEALLYWSWPLVPPGVPLVLMVLQPKPVANV
jgi:hypothetical protein